MKLSRILIALCLITLFIVQSASADRRRLNRFADLVVTGQGLFAAGSAATPSISFDSDPDTGIYRVGANQLGASAGGTIVATFDSGGLTLPDTATIDMDDGEYLRHFQTGALRSFIGYSSALGFVVDSDASIKFYPGNTLSGQFTSGGEFTFTGVSGDGTGKATCVKSDGNIGTCSDAVGGGGTCTCG